MVDLDRPLARTPGTYGRGIGPGSKSSDRRRGSEGGEGIHGQLLRLLPGLRPLLPRLLCQRQRPQGRTQFEQGAIGPRQGRRNERELLLPGELLRQRRMLRRLLPRRLLQVVGRVRALRAR